MRRFLRFFALFLKYRFKSTAFWVSAGMLLLLFGSFALLCPTTQPASAQIGLMYDANDSTLQNACAPLLASDTLRFVHYPPEALASMQRDVRTGVLHCAYSISQTAAPPITVYENDGAFLTPVTDELVFAAWFETQLPKITLSAAEKLNLTDQALILAEMQRLQSESSPMMPVLTLNAAAAPKAENGIGLSPLLYAVLVPLFLLCVVFSALLSKSHERELAALLSLRCPSRPYLPAAAATLAQALLFAALPALCEGLLWLLHIKTGYALTARLTLVCLLALAAALIAPAVSRLRPRPALLLAAVLWAASSVIFSGAILTPEALGHLGALKYLSPPWYLLRLMTALS